VERPKGRFVDWRTGLVAVGVTALALRLLYLAELQGTSLVSILIGDGRQYDDWAQRIAGGQWVGKDVFYQTPLYPYLMAVVYAIVGHAVLAVRVLQAFLGATACVLLAMAGRRFFDERAGLAAGALLAVYPPAIFFDGLIQKSSIDAFLVSLLLLALASLLPRPRWPSLLVAGATLAAFMLNRENARVLYPVIVLWLLFYFRDASVRRRVTWALVFTAATAALLFPVGLRNYAVGGEFLVSTSQLGPNLYIGNHRGASGSYEPLVAGHGSPEFEREDATRLAQKAAGRTLTPGQVSDYWLGRALAFMRSEPASWLALTGRKLALVVNARELVDTESIEAYARYSQLLAGLIWFNFGIVLPLAAVGAWRSRADWKRLSILYASAAAFALSVAFFYVVARYRYPIVPLALLFAGSGIVSIAGHAARILRPSGRLVTGELWPAVAACALAAFASNVSMHVGGDDTFLNVGEELVRNGRPAEAIPLLEKAAAASPDYAPAHFNLGVALSRTGDRAGALAHFQSAVRLQPDDFEAEAALALALEESGDLAGAVEHFRTAARLNTADPKLAFDLANVLVQAGRPEEAIRHYSVAIQLDPEYAEAHANSALALRSMGKDAAALAPLEEAARLQPGSAVIQFSLADLLNDLHRAEDAMGHYEAAARLAPESLEFQYSVAQAYARAKRWPDALAALERSLTVARTQGRDPAIHDIEAAISATRTQMAHH
jgi:tetratricopeptide (TPR) repeat protein